MSGAPAIGCLPFLGVQHSTLIAIADSQKTYNNDISALRRTSEFGYRDFLAGTRHPVSCRLDLGIAYRHDNIPRSSPDANACYVPGAGNRGYRKPSFVSVKPATGLRRPPGPHFADNRGSAR